MDIAILAISTKSIQLIEEQNGPPKGLRGLEDLGEEALALPIPGLIKSPLKYRT